MKCFVLCLVMLMGASSCRALDADADTFELLNYWTNPIAEGADPWMTRLGDHYYFCQSAGDAGIMIWKSDCITDKGTMRRVWTAPKAGWNRAQIWAPELHYLGGRWYIYYAASDGRNETHRMGVLRARTDDPQGAYEDLGMLYTGDAIATGADNRWAIDGTPLEHRGKLYFVWSGWQDDRDIQWNYIAEMTNPWTIASNRVRLAANDTHLWERVDESPDGRGLHEAAQILKSDDKIYIVYSCSGSWQASYKLNWLWMDNDDDPMDPASWHKSPQPVFVGEDRVLGTGHPSFVTSPDGAEDWIVYHTKISPQHGWQRVVMAQPFSRTQDGTPVFGKPVQPGELLPYPSGRKIAWRTDAFSESFEDNLLDRWVYYGHSSYVDVKEGRLHLGGQAAFPRSNAFRTGEKALVRGHAWRDFVLTTQVFIQDGRRDAGVVFRVHAPATGYDAMRGYFAGIIPESGRVVLGRMDGFRWHEIARGDAPIQPRRRYELRVEARGDALGVFLDGKPIITCRDDQYPAGMAGVRVVDTHATFDNFEVVPLP
ncbi:MAG: family 43 glycosylhydrolase [Phycisphaerae bacterium]|nr:family 43 glycosylhydrolase [Phycisphaerae bacterium]